LTLRPVDVRGPARWRWLLVDGVGQAVAHHEVELDRSAAEYGAFGDLYEYVRSRRLPDDVVASEADIVERVGRWVGEHVFGPRLGRALVGTVRVEVPPEADFLLSRPLELAHVDGVPLSRLGVSLVFDLVPSDAAPRVPKEPVGEALRILALFSLPVGGSVLNLRRERFELAKTVRRLRTAADEPKAIQLRLLQYGVTRKRLKEAAAEYPGWDILHVSGHGERGVVLLEHADGSPDQVPTNELVDLLTPARGRLKVAVVAACNSGAEMAAASLRAMALDEAADQVEPPAGGNDDSAGSGVQVGLARGLVQRLGVAVVGMRFPVVDTFAIALTGELYPLLLGAGQPVDRAVALAVPQAAGDRPTMARPALSIGTPAVFGPAVGLRVAPPAGRVVLDPSLERMAWFPDEPNRFVGRTPALTAAGRVLAPASDTSTVLFVGMAGAGKTTCAVELAYQHRDRFAAGMLWWQAPTHPDEFDQAMSSFAHAVEAQLGIPFMQAIGSESALRQFLPRLRAVLRDNAVLVVVDNAETLLSDGRAWRDPLWALLMEALRGHGGLSRLVVTSRHTPHGWDGDDRVLVQPTHALSLAESVLLARELPHLGKLLDDEPHPERSATEVSERLALARRVLHVVQGHPKLLELADVAAGEDLDRLRAQLDAAERAEGRAELGRFFTAGVSGLDGDQFVEVLRSWTATVVTGLPEAARALAGLVACVEDDDRHTTILKMVWPVLWRQLHGQDAPVPDLADTLAALAAAAIVEVEPDPETPADNSPRPGDEAVPHGAGVRPARVLMHPGIAEAVRRGADPGFARLVDELCGGLWSALYQHAAEGEQRGEQASGAIVRAGLSGAPYLIRRCEWVKAGLLLERAAQRDRSPGVTRRVLGLLGRVIDGNPDLDTRLAHEGMYASALTRVDPVAAQSQLRLLIDRSLDGGNPAQAAVSATHLFNLLLAQGDLTAALALVDEQARWFVLTGDEQWRHAVNDGMRLQVLTGMGEHGQVLADATALLDRLDAMSAGPGPIGVQMWNLRETVADTARSAALALRSWAEALEFSRKVQDSKHRRGASLHDRTRTRFNDYFPLLRLRRFDEAEAVLLACQQVFDDAGDIPTLGVVYSARADLEAQRGRHGEAIRWEESALRYKYQRPEPELVAVSHNNLATHLVAAGRAGREVLGHRLAGLLLRRATGRAGTYYTDNVQLLGDDLRRYGDAALPTDADQVVHVVQQVAGVRFGEVFASLVPDSATRGAMYADAIATARQTPDLRMQVLREWAPIIAAVAAEADGGPQARYDLEPFLADLADDPHWADVVSVLRRIIAGERDPAELTTGLDDIDTAIATAVLDAVRQRPDP
jgi:tetratricopeptide (TPR) repeat protein